jgi:hypothetical protein
MARAPGHNFGQTIGNFCEASLGPVLKEFAAEHGLYLDQKGEEASKVWEVTTVEEQIRVL